MSNLTVKCAKQCKHKLVGFCRLAQARGYFSGLFDERGIKYPRHRNIWKNGNCKWEAAMEIDTKDVGRKFDNRKLRYDLILAVILEYLAGTYTYGAIKYDDNNYKELDNIDKRYEGALFRHFQAYRKGKMFDKDSGLLHIGQAFWNAGTLLWREIEKLEACGVNVEESFEQLIDLWILRETNKEEADRGIKELIDGWNKKLTEGGIK